MAARVKKISIGRRGGPALSAGRVAKFMARGAAIAKKMGRRVRVVGFKKGGGKKTVVFGARSGAPLLRGGGGGG